MVVLYAILVVTWSWIAGRGPVETRRGYAMLALYAAFMLLNEFHQHPVFWVACKRSNGLRNIRNSLIGSYQLRPHRESGPTTVPCGRRC